MTPELLFPKNVIVQCITGSQGSFHTQAMLAAGTNIVGGTSPSKAGEQIHGVPVYKTIADIQADHQIDASVIFVPAAFSKAAILEAVNANIPLVICITEGIPVHDMLYIQQHMKGKSTRFIGPNSPGILLPGHMRLGIIPDHMGMQGSVGIVSRSGTLTYEAMAGLTDHSVGQKYVIGIGGDPIKGTGFIDCLQLFQDDPDVTHIVMMGEIGGTEELEAAEYIAKNITKPVFCYIAGHHAPAGVQLGHAGAILGSHDESAATKTTTLAQAGCSTYMSVVELIAGVASDIATT
jgi:succinyl-CoA synthetase alpha subunit